MPSLNAHIIYPTHRAQEHMVQHTILLANTKLCVLSLRYPVQDIPTQCVQYDRSYYFFVVLIRDDVPRTIKSTIVANHVFGVTGIDRPKRVFRLQVTANGNHINKSMPATMANAIENAFMQLEHLRCASRSIGCFLRCGQGLLRNITL